MKVAGALRAERSDVTVHVLGDAGFGLPLMCGVCEANGLSYALGRSQTTGAPRRCRGAPVILRYG